MNKQTPDIDYNIKLTKAWLKSHERTQAYLAKKVGQNYATVWHFFKGGPVSINFLIAVKEYTGLPLRLSIKGYELVKK